MSLANAKKRFHELSGLRREKSNPKQIIEQEAQKESNTIAKIVTEWYKNYAEKNRKKPLQIKQQIDPDIVPLLGHFSLEKIQTIDIAKALDKIVARGAPIHANRVLSTIKQAFNYGVSRGNLQYNPATNIRARDIGGIEKPRDRVLSLDEIKKIWLFLDSNESQMTFQTKCVIKIILLTGVRTAELRLATWDEIDMKNSLWTIPASHCKSGETLKIHLSESVKEILCALSQKCNAGHIIYGDSPHQPLSENALSRTIARIQIRVGIPKWTAHDLRRTFATHLGETLRIDPVVIEKCLGHKMPRIMATYNKNEMLPERREALNKWAQYVENFAISSNVISLHIAI